MTLENRAGTVRNIKKSIADKKDTLDRLRESEFVMKDNFVKKNHWEVNRDNWSLSGSLKHPRQLSRDEIEAEYSRLQVQPKTSRFKLRLNKSPPEKTTKEKSSLQKNSE